MSKCNRYRCFPMSFPCQISEEVGLLAYRFPGSSPPSWPQARRVGTPSSLCQDISLTPAILLVLLHAAVSAAGDDLEKALAKKKAEEEQETLELLLLIDNLPIATEFGGEEGFCVNPPTSPKLKRHAVMAPSGSFWCHF